MLEQLIEAVNSQGYYIYLSQIAPSGEEKECKWIASLYKRSRSASIGRGSGYGKTPYDALASAFSNTTKIPDFKAMAHIPATHSSNSYQKKKKVSLDDLL